MLKPPTGEDVATHSGSIAEETGVEIDDICREAAAAVQPWLGRMLARTWTGAGPDVLPVELDITHGLSVGERSQDPPYLDIVWAVAATFATTALEREDQQSPVKIAAARLLRKLGFRQHHYEEGTVGAWLAAGGCDGLDARGDRSGIELHIENALPTTWRPAVEGDEVYLYARVGVGERVEWFIDRVRDSARGLLCPVASDARARVSSALESALNAVAPDDEHLATEVVDSLSYAFRDGPRPDPPAESWVTFVEREMLLPFIEEKTTLSLPNNADPMYELLRVRKDRIDVTLYVDRLKSERGGPDLGVLKPVFRIVSRDPDSGEMTDVLEQQVYFGGFRLTDLYCADVTNVDPAWLPMLRERWLTILERSIVQSLERDGRLLMPADFITGEPLRVCLICLEEGGPPELDRPAPSFDIDSALARKSASELRVCDAEAVEALDLDGVELALSIGSYQLAICPQGQAPGLYLRRGDERPAAIVVDWGQDGFLSCDGDEPLIRGLLSWLSAAIERLGLHVEWQDEWGDTTSATEWLRFLDRDRLEEPLDWRGAQGVVVDWPYTPELEAQRARLVYYDFVRAHLFPELSPR